MSKKECPVHVISTGRKILAGALASLMLLSAGCATEQTETSEPLQIETQTETESVQETQNQETIPEEDLTGGYEVQTPIGTLYYPEEQKEHLTVETDTLNGMFVADFSVKLEHENVVIFSLLMGAHAEGHEVGSMTGMDGVEYVVSLQVSAGANDPHWTEEERTLVQEMQNRVNDILDQIYHLEGFRAAEPPRQ